MYGLVMNVNQSKENYNKEVVILVAYAQYEENDFMGRIKGLYN